ncbi:MAG: radical SAM protein [Methylophagaceae bacterium]|jgi:organic radical activating enzyme
MIVFSDPISIIINNTCNLTCSNCGSNNQYNYRGVYNWLDYAEHFREWQKKIDFVEINIVGGEPFLHTDLATWAIELKKLWPNALVSVDTNGTLLGLEKNVHVARTLLENDIKLMVFWHTAHDINRGEVFLNKILEPYDIEIVVEDGYQVGTTRNIYYEVHSQNVLAELGLTDRYFPSTIKEIKNGIVYLDDTDDIQASHDVCHYATDCVSIQCGLMYKCTLPMTYANSKDQFTYEERVRPLLDQYKACSPFWEYNKIKQFIENLKNPIPQCRFCAFDKRAGSKDCTIPVTFDKSLKKIPTVNLASANEY